MKLGKALATGIAEEAPRDVAAEPGITEETAESTAEAVAPEPVEVPAAR
ncbi:hypothetical protein [Streptomyces sp. VRA16 Mangrove soil]|nr:hypothetical protein [Streptomyces sp. VRA16 Mangrove soil]MBO1335284.1 hypothetical protein [Streptomyces sp. VRA16 Mangrove soil]